MGESALYAATVDRYSVSPPDLGVLSGKKVVVPIPLLSSVSIVASIPTPRHHVHLIAHVAMPLNTCSVVFDLVINGSGTSPDQLWLLIGVVKLT